MYRAIALVWLSLSVVGCAAPVASPSPRPEATTASPTPTTSASPTPVPSTVAPAVTSTPTASATTASAPIASLPINGSADEIIGGVQIARGVLMAPGLKGFLYVSIPRPGGSLLVLLDPNARPYPGWPIALGQSNACGLLLPYADGSVRLACTRGDYPDATLWVYAFDTSGRSMAGWPVNLGTVSLSAGRMIGEELTILTGVYRSDGAEEVWITRIGVDGVPHRGVRAVIAAPAVRGEWAIGPDGVAYGTFQATNYAPTPAEYAANAKSALFAVGSGGIAAGFPVSITGWASQPAFDGAGRVHLVVGSMWQPPTRMLVFDTAGRAAAGGSVALDVAAPADSEQIGPSGHLAPPLVEPDATRFVVAGFNDTTVIAIGPSGQPLAGLPYRSDAGRQMNFICPPSAACDSSSFAAPAIGPGNVLYVLQSAPFSATGPSGGGSIVAIGPDGRVRPGWPRMLKRDGSGFWSVVVGSNGTAYALAIERESVGYSATVLAIAPDSTVRYATTIIEP